LLTEAIPPTIKASAQGANDMVMNLAAACGGALAGVIIAVLGYGWLCGLAALPIVALVVRAQAVAAAA
jgi:predicted MFS family arabinose efflux permease